MTADDIVTLWGQGERVFTWNLRQFELRLTTGMFDVGGEERAVNHWQLWIREGDGLPVIQVVEVEQLPDQNTAWRSLAEFAMDYLVPASTDALIKASLKALEDLQFRFYQEGRGAERQEVVKLLARLPEMLQR